LLQAILATHFVDDHMEKALSGIQTSMRSVEATRQVLTVTSRYATSIVFYTDGSLIDECSCSGFVIHRTEEGGFGNKISSPTVIFTVEFTALFVTLGRIVEDIQAREKYLILTDSLSSVKALLSRKIFHRTHPLVYEYKPM
jgi:hypothetical protein